VTRRASPRLGAYAGLSALGLVAALVLRLPELVVLAAPFALLLAVGLALAQEPRVEVDFSIERERALEDDEVAAELAIVAGTSIERLEAYVAVPAGLAIDRETNPVALQLRQGDERAVELAIRCLRWGGYTPGEVYLRGRDRLGLFAYEQALDLRRPLRVYPRAQTLLGLIGPAETQVFAGNEVARTKGEGIEFADLRPFVYGDRVRRINWRASARRGELVVNEHHPERNTDVILFLDSFTEAREAAGGTLELAVRAAATLAGRYLDRKDRVGLVGFGGVLTWLLPASGVVQLYRIVDALVGTEIVLSYAWKDIDLIPPRTLPPKALVIALTPLLDERGVTALLDLRARGFDLAIVEVSPLPFAAAGADEPEMLAHRLWRLKREALRYRFERVGVPVAQWHEGDPLAGPVEEVAAFRRHARVARA
jgi:uncharacterized protein (DUF58 family)